MASELKQVLHMNEGTGETSYARTSYIQKEALSLTRCIREEAIREFCYCSKELPTTLTMADLGCSSAVQNTLDLIFELISTVEKARRQHLGHKKPQEYQIYLNDLPGNDFNTVFKEVSSFEDQLQQHIEEGQFGHFFVSGVPGSFYGRLFPSNSLHFVHSSYSLMWLSQVPKGVEENKGNIYIARTSPLRVMQAYFKQFQKDFSMFIRCRSKEVVEGGRMVLTILGRKNNEPYSKESCYMWELLSTVLNDMVSEGIIEEEKLHKFNIPQYTPSPSELQFLVEREGYFALNKVYVSQVKWGGGNNHENGSSCTTKAFDEYDFARCMRSVAEPLLVSHFGETIIDEVFERYLELVHVSMGKEKNAFVNVTVSMTRN